eukprot:3528378-Rhodomonas_salina.1
MPTQQPKPTPNASPISLHWYKYTQPQYQRALREGRVPALYEGGLSERGFGGSRRQIGQAYAESELLYGAAEENTCSMPLAQYRDMA